MKTKQHLLLLSLIFLFSCGSGEFKKKEGTVTGYMIGERFNTLAGFTETIGITEMVLKVQYEKEDLQIGGEVRNILVLGCRVNGKEF